ncbi:MAG: hypothetical protein MJE68_05130, partial [Proteobacteria bacterium]|nr:hypothetical protein [Pseudomonadota bacterium]
MKDIDAACLDFVRSYELENITEEINKYFNDSFPGVGTQYGPGSHQNWFSCTLSHSQDCLSPTAVSY